ncbi:hypothetical protein PC129_g18688 [Phytophthora cactorum]|uniref:Uncharacterized protein n=1 Tax=Phytophthora cactorum TaxID=29920 RepID=A0A8T1F3U2_9STRA|nr:hypothetical protein Pcac1_g5471 [Phytophthora cactorum]KAG2798747.1 hypothetical protein PC112_g21222 [Phytophthora cactorum]KAG2799042.1 hypothetical protein PC111_g20588 [Phytophthora cactorum]KAG2829743.1 hypothetical protein PC113_g21231 [Phytophthora cactorum]KAG2877758.1 hypothetical protein PC114_g23484 [Phytophthora cactorum]
MIGRQLQSGLSWDLPREDNRVVGVEVCYYIFGVLLHDIHVFISDLSAGYQCVCLKRKTSSTLEEAFAVALREDYSVTASLAFDVSHAPASEPEPEPMEIDSTMNVAGRRHRLHGRARSHAVRGR